MTEYCLKLDEHQARVVARACEFYCRIYLGQFQEITDELMLLQNVELSEWCSRRDKAEDLLFEARKYIYPELYGKGHSYGVGKYEQADTAWNAYQVLRHALGDARAPYPLFNSTLPEIEVKESE